MFLPKPEATRDSKRTTSFFPSLFSRVLAHSPIGTITSRWNILKWRVLLNWRQRSQASRNRFGHRPG